jgi:hypothetical protein
MSLQVVWNSADEKQIEADLRKLNQNFFLDRDRDRGGPVYYVVREWLGSGTEPLRILDWKDERGNPKPLNSGLLYEVEKRKANFGRDLHAEAMKANDALQEKRDQEALEEYAEVAEDFKKHRLGNFALVPRSVGLARSRAKARERKAEQMRLNEQARRLEYELAREQRRS